MRAKTYMMKAYILIAIFFCLAAGCHTKKEGREQMPLPEIPVNP